MSAQPSTAVVSLRPQALARAPFGDWTYHNGAAALKALLPKNYDELRKYAIERDAWQGGGQWVGPGDTATNTRIREQFAPDDVVGEALDNVGNALSEPQVSMPPVDPLPEDEQVPNQLQHLIDEAESALFDWWDRQRVQERTLDCVYASAFAGRAAMRLWVPGRYLLGGDDVRFIPTSDIRTALSYIHVVAPDPSVCGVVTDPATQEKCAVFLDEEEITEGGAKRTVKRCELVYRDPDALPGEDADTIIRVVYADAMQQGSEARLEIGGHMLTAEMEARPLLTDPVLRTQRQLNYICSLLTRIAESGGFPERYIRNAKPIGIRLPYTDGEAVPEGAFVERDDGGRLWVVVPTERTLGANTTTELVGLPRYGEGGEVAGYETPGVDRFEPVDPTPYMLLADRVRARILRMCKQGHLAGTATAESSGVAYEQARAVFAKDLNRRRVAEEGMLRDILTAALRLAEHIAGKPGHFTKQLKVAVDQHVDAGPRSPESVRVDMEAVGKSLLSRQTAMSRIGVEDPAAEINRLESDPGAQVGRWKELAGVLSDLSSIGMPSDETAVTMLVDAGFPIDDKTKEVERLKEARQLSPGLPGSGLGREGIVIPGIDA
jgi:hypothetical protein